MIEAWTALYALLRDRKTEDLRKLKDATEYLYKASCYLDAESYNMATVATERAMRAAASDSAAIRCKVCGGREVQAMLLAVMTLKGPSIPMRQYGTRCADCGHRDGADG